MISRRLTAVLRQVVRLSFFLLLFSHSAAKDAPASIDDDAIRDAFRLAHDGFSSDELLVRDDLRGQFVREVEKREHRTLGPAEECDVLLRLLKLRKSGRLAVPTTNRTRGDSEWSAVGEVAARVVSDRHRVSLDTLFADPRLRAEFDREATLIAPAVDLTKARRSVLSLRKKRSLKPELVLRVAEWKREVITMKMEDARRAVMDKSISDGPGVYLFRDTSGYLYIGEAKNLAARITEHLTGSDRLTLAAYLASADGTSVSLELHVFAKDSPASKLTMRRAYESELIRSRNPKFNVRP